MLAGSRRHSESECIYSLHWARWYLERRVTEEPGGVYREQVTAEQGGGVQSRSLSYLCCEALKEQSLLDWFPDVAFIVFHLLWFIVSTFLKLETHFGLHKVLSTSQADSYGADMQEITKIRKKCFFCCFETGLQYVAKIGLEITM